MTSTCPKCDRPVSIPSGVDSSARVRCPLCSAEYALSEALTPPPPELIPVAVTDETTLEPQQDSEGENEAAAVARRFPAMPVTARRRRKPKSALQTVIEVIAGGIAGCLVAYYGLAFYYGPDFCAKGLPQLPLPGISWITAPRAAAEDAKDKEPAKSNRKAANHDGADARSPCSPGQNGIQFG